jgi:hypothetical protein
MSFEDWVKNGWLEVHKSSKEEIANLLGIVERDLKDSRAKDVSNDWRFAIAYNVCPAPTVEGPPRVASGGGGAICPQFGDGIVCGRVRKGGKDNDCKKRSESWNGARGPAIVKDSENKLVHPHRRFRSGV